MDIFGTVTSCYRLLVNFDYANNLTVQRYEFSSRIINFLEPHLAPYMCTFLDTYQIQITFTTGSIFIVPSNNLKMPKIHLLIAFLTIAALTNVAETVHACFLECYSYWSNFSMYFMTYFCAILSPALCLE